MHVLPFPIDTVTEAEARSFFKRGVDLLHYGSLFIDNGYEPRVVKTGSKGLGWSIRFKLFTTKNVRVSKKLDGSSRIQRKSAIHVRCKDYATKEEAESRCYRDIYARVHWNTALFKTKAECDRETATKARSARANKRSNRDPRDAADSKRRQAITNFQKVRQEILDQAARLSSLRTRSKRKVPATATEALPLPPKKSRAELKMERAVSKHKALVDAKLLNAQAKLENAVGQVSLLKQAYHQLKSELEDREYSYHQANTRKVSKTSGRAVSVTTGSSLQNAVSCAALASASSCDVGMNDDEPDNSNAVLISLALASLSQKQVKHLFKQFKAVFLCYTAAVKLWTAYIASLEKVGVGQQLPRAPSAASIIRAACHARETDTGCLSKKDRFQARTMRKCLNYWDAHKSFKTGGCAGGALSWCVASHTFVAHTGVINAERKMKDLNK